MNPEWRGRWAADIIAGIHNVEPELIKAADAGDEEADRLMMDNISIEQGLLEVIITPMEQDKQ